MPYIWINPVRKVDFIIPGKNHESGGLFSFKI
jgi:hypothetical protein